MATDDSMRRVALQSLHFLSSILHPSSLPTLRQTTALPPSPPPFPQFPFTHTCSPLMTHRPRLVMTTSLLPTGPATAKQAVLISCRCFVGLIEWGKSKRGVRKEGIRPSKRGRMEMSNECGFEK